MFDINQCNKCGICLENCPVIELDINQAQEEIENLINGSSFIIDECTICGTCDLNCPNNLTPMDLIKELKYTKIKELEESGKIRRSNKFIFPFHEPNIFRFYEGVMMSTEEAKNLEKWESPQNSKELVLLGCAISYALQDFFKNPTIEGLLKGKTIAGGIEFCCGEVYHRTCFPISKNEIEDRLHSNFTSLGVEKLIVFCNECYEAYNNEYKRISNDFEIISIWEIITKAIESGDLQLTNKLGYRVVLQDQCVIKKYPPLMDYPRKIIEATGCELVELDHNRENALCCGLPLGLTNRKAMEKIRRKRFNEIKKADTKFIINTCIGCIFNFSLDFKIQRGEYKVLSVLDLLRMSCGEGIDMFKNVRLFNDIINTAMSMASKRS
ncbi:MAG: (Fe-S)-binding protein [Candidatus Hermodarchaeota archaeon]